MKKYTIRANESLLRTKDGQKNTCLQHDTDAYYHADYIGGKGRNAIEGTIENLDKVGISHMGTMILCAILNQI